MSPAGSKLRRRCRMNPALINCCAIDWYEEWTREASLSVAHVYFQNTEFVAEDNVDIEVKLQAKMFGTDHNFYIKLEYLIRAFYLLKSIILCFPLYLIFAFICMFQDLKTNVGLMCVDMHDDVKKLCDQFYNEMKRYFYVTPSSYMELIRVYSTMMHKQKTEFVNNKYVNI